MSIFGLGASGGLSASARRDAESLADKPPGAPEIRPVTEHSCQELIRTGPASDTPDGLC